MEGNKRNQPADTVEGALRTARVNELLQDAKTKAFNKAHHKPVRDDTWNAACKKSRDLSQELFGYGNDPLKIDIQNALSALSGMEHHTNDIEIAREHLNARPYIRNMLSRRICKPPECYEVTPGIEGIVEAAEHLAASRHYRSQNAFVDKQTKRYPSNPGGDSTFLKFELGIKTDGAFHPGSGGPCASSVPHASVKVDKRRGQDVLSYTVDDVLSDMVVSDVAISSSDGLGVGTYPAHVDWLVSMANAGKYVIGKISMEDLGRLDYDTYHILHKPRPHNMEVIISLNIPGVSLDPESLIDALLADNDRRNLACYMEDIPYEEEEGEVDSDLLFDDTDFCELELTSNETIRALEAKTKETDRSPEKLQCLIDDAAFVYSDSYNKTHLKGLMNTNIKVTHLLRGGRTTVLHVEGLDEFGEDTIKAVTVLGRHLPGTSVLDPQCVPAEIWLTEHPALTIWEISSYLTLMRLILSNRQMFLLKTKKNYWRDLFYKELKKKNSE